MSLHDVAAQMVALKEIRDRVDAEREKRKAQFLADGEEGDRTTAKLDGQIIGAVSIVKARETAKIVDEAALTQWVMSHFPTEIETINRVRTSFLNVILKSVKENGGWIDAKTGEFLAVDGVDVAVGDPYVSVKVADGASEIVAKAWSERRIEIGP